MSPRANLLLLCVTLAGKMHCKVTASHLALNLLLVTGTFTVVVEVPGRRIPTLTNTTQIWIVYGWLPAYRQLVRTVQA